MVDESSVDYVKKFRDLAKKMSNDTEAVSNSREVADSLPSSNSNSTVSFNALLSDATSRYVMHYSHLIYCPVYCPSFICSMFHYVFLSSKIVQVY